MYSSIVLSLALAKNIWMCGVLLMSTDQDLRHHVFLCGVLQPMQLNVEVD